MKDSGGFDGLDGIAVVGMAGRFPGARNVDAFWHNLREGVESITFFSDEDLVSEGVDPALLGHPNYVKAGSILNGIEMFDATFFGYSPRDAEIIDPQQRLFLECAWEALEAAGYNPETYRGQIGVYAGLTENDYWLKNLHSHNGSSLATSGFSLIVGNDKDYLATRVSYKLNLRGPSVTVQTACSTALVAVHLASQALLNGECDMALAGGVSIRIPQKSGYLHQEGMIYSRDGHCRAFDAGANGTIFGSGMGIVVLKRMADACADRDSIQAIIKGSAINNDGSAKIGYTAPSIDGQAHVIAEAMEAAGVDPATVRYVEAHGTGTPLGDPIEISALEKAFGTGAGANGFCALGSVKTNIGHLNVAAGAASLIKAVLALKHRQIPPSLNFSEPNPKIDFANSPFFVNTKLSDWKEGTTPRRAGVNSFGVGGTNAHAVLEEAPAAAPSGPSRPWQLLLLSAKSDTALDAATGNLAAHFQKNPDLNLADVAFTLMTGRKPMANRRIAVCKDVADARMALETVDSKRLFSSTPVREDSQAAFMFTGQGSQYVNMALELYSVEPFFREQIDRCSELLRSILRLDLRDLLYPDPEHAETAAEQLNQTAITQPALFVVEYALATLLMDWGIQPHAMIGHSIGEYVAACLAGVFSLKDALALVAFRGQLMNQLPAGSMLAVSLPENEADLLLGDQLSLAVVNGPSSCVISGPTPAIEDLEKRLKQKRLSGRRLNTSHAFHSKMMEPVLAQFAGRVRQAGLHPPRIPYLSNVTGTWITKDQAMDPAYWARHLRQTVRFSQGLGELLREPDQVLLEVGPGQTLFAMAKRHPDKAAGQIILSCMSNAREHQSDEAHLLTTLGKLWLAGMRVDWDKFYANEQRYRLPLPTYPFERQRYWIEPLKDDLRTPGAQKAKAASPKKLNIDDWFYVPAWKQSVPPMPVVMDGDGKRKPAWMFFMDPCGLSLPMVQRLRQQGHSVVTVEAGGKFERTGTQEYVIHPGRRADYESLFKELGNAAALPDKIVHMWTIAPVDTGVSHIDSSDNSMATCFYSLLYLSQVIGEQKATNALNLWVISNDIFDITGREELCPNKAVILGPCRTIPQEYPNVTCRYIDLDASALEIQRNTGCIDRLMAEISVELSDAIVAYRGRHRWVQNFEPLALKPIVDGNTRLKQRGVYLITGGLGGIGLELAEYLAQSAQAKLVLLGRSVFPGRDEWEEWLAGHAGNDPISGKIQKLKTIEGMGAETLVLSADVSDREQMRAAISRVQEQFGAINGVIHAAGIAGGGAIQRKNPETAASVLAPKIRGTWVLNELLQSMPLDFWVLCSSTFAIRSQFGQVDYCAANSFLDAFAHFKSARPNTFAISINWDAWLEVGMAADAAATRTSTGVRSESPPVSADHPLLDRCLVETADRIVCMTEVSVSSHWILKEHRIMGKAAIPGTAYLEMARAAFELKTQNAKAEIRDAIFLAPLLVEEDEKKEVYTILQRKGDTFNFLILSKSKSESDDPPRWQEHAKGEISDFDGSARILRDREGIISRCQGADGNPGIQWAGGGQETFVSWGPHWQTIKHASVQGNEVLGNLELSGQFASDLKKLKLHPSLLDVATGLGVLCAGKDNYLPLSYRTLKIFAPLSARLNIYALCKEAGSGQKETLAFDIMIFDEHGNSLVQIEEMTFRRIADPAALRNDRTTRASQSPALETQAHYYESLVADPKRLRYEFGGISPKEGAIAFGRILAGITVPQVAVSIRDFYVANGQAEAAPPDLQSNIPDAEGSQSRHPRPNVQTSYVAPRNEAEKILATIWQDVLGIEQVGANDDFFSLGGDSVIAIQIISKANRAGFQFASNQIFECPTVAELAQMSMAEKNIIPSKNQIGESAVVDKVSENPYASRPDSNEFGWTQEELARISEAVKKSV
jgi:acyl transferase domain-containing protein